MTYELFEHTADLGLRVRAADLEGLFRDAARGLFSMIAEPEPRGAPDERLTFRLEGERLDFLLFDWLDELLYASETRGMVLGGFEVRLADDRLRADAGGYRLDSGEFRLLHEVKAITYHGLQVVRADGGWLAEVIVDI